jgi:dTMP kinase
MENPAMGTATVTSKRFYGKGLPNVDLALLKGKLIINEGADGSGRSTQIALLRNWLEHLGYPTAEIGLKRSTLVGRELEEVKRGNILSPLTFSLFYATDFADQLENIIIPALQADFIVLADRYIYNLMARDIVRGVDSACVKEMYSIALVPDAVFYLKVSPRELAERNFRKNGMLDYWESGMDIQRSGDMFDCFIRYQRQMQRLFHAMQKTYGFEIINANRSPGAISGELIASSNSGRPSWVVQSGDSHPWAPSVLRSSESCPGTTSPGCYLMYYVGLSGQHTPVTHCIGVAWSLTPSGPFTDLGPLQAEDVEGATQHP